MRHSARRSRSPHWDDQAISFTTTVGGRTFTRKYPVDKILAVTIEGTRHVVNASSGARGSSGGSTATGGGTSGSDGGGTSREEVEALVDRMGRTPPDWWDSVSLDYPPALDLSWPQRPPGDWNAQRNVGHYIWDVINPNPSKWREGVRLVHHLLEQQGTNRDYLPDFLE